MPRAGCRVGARNNTLYRVDATYRSHHRLVRLSLFPNFATMPAPRWHNGQRRDLPPLGSQVKDEDAEPRLSQAGVPPPPTQLERPPDCINKFPTPNFGVLTHILDRLRTEKAIRRSETLSRFMDLWRLKVGNDLYPLIRLLLPDVG